MAAMGLSGAPAAIAAFEQLNTGATGLSGASTAIRHCLLNNSANSARQGNEKNGRYGALKGSCGHFSFWRSVKWA